MPRRAPGFSALPVLPPTRKPGALALRPVPETEIIRRSWFIRALVLALNTRRPRGAWPGSSFISVVGRHMPPLTIAA